MTLKDYLKINKMTIGEMARRLGIHRNYMSHIVHGVKIPSVRLALQIERATEGKVTVSEIMSEIYKKEHKQDVKTQKVILISWQKKE